MTADAAPVRLGDTLPEVTLQSATGEQVEIGDFLDRLLVLQCLRYYG